jgi:hypothetical protein
LVIAIEATEEASADRRLTGLLGNGRPSYVSPQREVGPIGDGEPLALPVGSEPQSLDTLRTKRLDDDGVTKLKAKAQRYAVPDPELRGHYVPITPTGVKSFWVVARDPLGKQHWRPIGTPGQMTIDQARTEAAKVIRTIRGATPNRFAAIAAQWLKMQCSNLRPRTVVEYARGI